MLFTSYSFIAFLIAIFVLYYIIPKKFQWVLLLAGSYFFYACAGIHFLAYIFATTMTTWFAAKRITAIQKERNDWFAAHKAVMDKEEKKNYKAETKKKTRGWFLACLLLNLAILAVIKYTDFVIENINNIFETGLTFMNFAVPMGISYYTFKSLGYLIDVNRGKYPCQDSLPKFALFVSFFPQVVQGPISRYDKLTETLFEQHSFDRLKIRRGFERVLWGYLKKLLIADRLVSAVKTLAGSPEEYTGAYVVLLIFLYAVQLYADFTGGIDITIGIGEMFGIGMEENFVTPYFSKDINEYWTRWHITMGTWFKDYIFYPISVSSWMLKLSKNSREKLGKGIGKRVPVYLANIIVWFATGIWHGAAWNFIVWGMLNCVVTLASYEMEPLYSKFHKKAGWSNTKGYDVFQMFRTFWLMGAIRILDVYRNVPLSFKQLGTIFTRGHWGEMISVFETLELTGGNLIIIGVGCVLMLTVSIVNYRAASYKPAKRAADAPRSRKKRPLAFRDGLAAQPEILQIGIILLLFFCVIIFGAYGVGFDSNQFIYNQF